MRNNRRYIEYVEKECIRCGRVGVRAFHSVKLENGTWEYMCNNHERCRRREWQRNSETFNGVRDMSYFKPAKFQDYVTVAELSKIVGKDITWIRKLDRQGRLPHASRVQCGELQVRLWSPEQVEEIEEIFATMKIGRRYGR